MFDETSRSHTDDDSTRHIHRGHRPPEEKTVEVDSAAFFAPETAAPTPVSYTHLTLPTKLEV